jgi:hypothetical protein
MNKVCDICRKGYYRSNLVRTWIANNWGHRAGWVRVIQKICCHCLQAAEAREVLRDVNPKWRPTRPHERVAGVTPERVKTNVTEQARS